MNTPAADTAAGPARSQRLANAITGVYAIATLVALLMWLSRRVFANHLRLSWAEMAFWTANIPATPSIVSFTGLGLLTVGLLYHKRLALWIVIVMQIIGGAWAGVGIVMITAVSNEPEILARRDEVLPLLVVSVAIAVLTIPILVRLRPAFPARVPPGSWAAALGVLGGGLVLAIAATEALVLIWPGASGPAWQQTVTALMHAVGMTPPHSWNVHVAHLVPQIASLIMAIALILGDRFWWPRVPSVRGSGATRAAGDGVSRGARPHGSQQPQHAGRRGGTPSG